MDFFFSLIFSCISKTSPTLNNNISDSYFYYSKFFVIYCNLIVLFKTQPMQFLSSYQIFLDKRFIIEYHEGVMTLERMKTFIIKESSDQDYSPNFDMLLDIRQITFKGFIKDIKDYIEFLRSHKGISGKRKLAVLTSKPHQVVFSTFLSMFSVKLPQTMKIFSSLEAALFWLGDPVDTYKVNSCLNHLKEKKELCV